MAHYQPNRSHITNRSHPRIQAAARCQRSMPGSCSSSSVRNLDRQRPEIISFESLEAVTDSIGSLWHVNVRGFPTVGKVASPRRAIRRSYASFDLAHLERAYELALPALPRRGAVALEGLFALGVALGAALGRDPASAALERRR